MAVRDGLLEVVRTETKGKSIVDWVRLTPRGVEYLHDHQSPTRALYELRQTLRQNGDAIPIWLSEMRSGLKSLDERLTAEAEQWTRRLDALTRSVEDVLRRIEEAAPLLPKELIEQHAWSVDMVNYLERRKNSGAPGDCSLPELFGALTRQHPALSVSAFHEGLRHLHDRRVLRLQPATNIADLPQPEYALFDDGQVLYFVKR
jgi:DNA-binding PadR family transcriptional regulator